MDVVVAVVWVAVFCVVGVGGSTRIVDGTQSVASLVVVGSGVGVTFVVTVDFSVVLGCSVLVGVTVVEEAGVGVFVEIGLLWLVGTSVGFEEPMRGVDETDDGKDEPLEPVEGTTPLVDVGTPGLMTEPDGPGVKV